MNLPTEIRYLIFNYLDIRSEIRLKGVNKWFDNNIVNIYKKLVDKLFYKMKQYCTFDKKYINMNIFDMDLKKICYQFIIDILEFLQHIIEYDGSYYIEYFHFNEYDSIYHIIAVPIENGTILNKFSL